ncbi:MAG TPA: cytochrome c3 family protein [Thermodesulfobacteriota bacterium]|nr:cytochrome c3 family protein [Thermodesulfobacteriota bacterium]
MAKVPRPNIGQPEQILLLLNGAKMAGVPFNHKEHEGNTTSCRVCHHHSELYPTKSVIPCNICHIINAQENGNPLALKSAYHRQCIDCHL